MVVICVTTLAKGGGFQSTRQNSTSLVFCWCCNTSTIIMSFIGISNLKIWYWTQMAMSGWRIWEFRPKLRRIIRVTPVGHRVIWRLRSFVGKITRLESTFLHWESWATNLCSAGDHILAGTEKRLEIKYWLSKHQYLWKRFLEAGREKQLTLLMAC